MGGRKVCWVKWNTVCQPKENGGLGVRDIPMVNVSLLAKWRWRLFACKNAFWKKVLIAKYKNIISGVADLGGEIWPRSGQDGGRMWCKFKKWMVQTGSCRSWSDEWGMERSQDFRKIVGWGKCLFVISFHG